MTNKRTSRRNNFPFIVSEPLFAIASGSVPHSDRITLKKQKYHFDPGHLKEFFKIRYFRILSCHYILRKVLLTSEKLNGAIFSHFKQTIIKYIWELNQNCILYIYIYIYM